MAPATPSITGTFEGPEDVGGGGGAVVEFQLVLLSCLARNIRIAVTMSMVDRILSNSSAIYSQDVVWIEHVEQKTINWSRASPITRELQSQLEASGQEEPDAIHMCFCGGVQTPARGSAPPAAAYALARDPKHCISKQREHTKRRASDAMMLALSLPALATHLAVCGGLKGGGTYASEVWGTLKPVPGCCHESRSTPIWEGESAREAHMRRIWSRGGCDKTQAVEVAATAGRWVPPSNCIWEEARLFIQRHGCGVQSDR